MNNICVIGAGAWGTALAELMVRAGRRVRLFARDPQLAALVGKTCENTKYLPGIRLSAALETTAVLKEALEGADIVIIAVPAQYARQSLLEIKNIAKRPVPFLNAAKGIEITSGKILSEIAAEILPGFPYAALSGPTFAGEAARGFPTALTLATRSRDGALWAEAIRSKTFRPYLSDDPVGAEIAGALKNVIAIACGIVEGRGLGQNAKAAVMTRGIAEIRRYGVQKGAKPDTFMGLAGIGDLTLTCNSMASRNFSLGFEVGQGRSFKDILASRHTVAEGVTTAKAITAAAVKTGTDMPICRAVNDVLHENADLDSIVEGLLSRDLKQESL